MNKIKIKIRDEFLTLDELRKGHEDENSYFIEFMECLYSHIELQQNEIERIECSKRLRSIGVLKIFCKHEYEFVRNIYERSIWKCVKCGKNIRKVNFEGERKWSAGVIEQNDDLVKENRILREALNSIADIKVLDGGNRLEYQDLLVVVTTTAHEALKY